MYVLYETLILTSWKRIEEIKIKVNFDYCFSVDYVGRSGVIVVLWINLFCVVS